MHSHELPQLLFRTEQALLNSQRSLAVVMLELDEERFRSGALDDERQVLMKEIQRLRTEIGDLELEVAILTRSLDQAKANAEQAKAFVGEDYICPACGEPYVKRHGRERYCLDCGWRAADERPS
jgi:hypothetical protein